MNNSFIYPLAYAILCGLLSTSLTVLADQQRGMTIEFIDGFDDPADSGYRDILNGYELRDNFWSRTGNASSDPLQDNGRLRLSVADESLRVTSKVHYLFNFFEQPLKFNVSGLDIQLPAAPANSNVSGFRLALTSDDNNAYNADDSLSFDIQHFPTQPPGSQWQLRLISRVDGVNLADKPNLFIAEAPDAVDIVLDSTGFMLVAYAADGSVLGRLQGRHQQQLSNWQNPNLGYVTSDGDAALQLKASAGSGSSVDVYLDEVRVTSLLHSELFANGALGEPWTEIAVGDNSGVTVVGNSLQFTTDDAVQSLAAIYTPRDLDYSFHAQPLKLSVDGIEFSGQFAQAVFSLNSEAIPSADSRDTISLLIASTGTVSIGARYDSGNNLPASTPCNLFGWRFSYCRELDNVTQPPVAFDFELNGDMDANHNPSFSGHSAVYYTLTLRFADGTSKTVTERLEPGEATTDYNSRQVLYDTLDVTHWFQDGGHDSRYSSLSVELGNWFGEGTMTLDSMLVERTGSAAIKPSVFGLVNDTVDIEGTGHDYTTTQPMAQDGFIDVTAPPFNADPSGTRDSTLALQKAIDYSLDNDMTVYFPLGDYRVTDTLSCGKKLYRRTNGGVLASYYGGCVLVGEQSFVSRPTLILSSNSPGYNELGVDGQGRKFVVDIWARCSTSEMCFDREGGRISPGAGSSPALFQPNISFWQTFSNIDIEVEPGNPGAVGIQFLAAEGSALTDSTINVTGAFAGVQGAAGSGGSHSGIEVIGGQYGFYITRAQPAAVLSGISLQGQTTNAIYHQGNMGPLTIVGADIDGSWSEAIKVDVENWYVEWGQINLIDVHASGNGAANTLIRSNRSVYLKNVFLENVDYAHISDSVDASALGVHWFPAETSPLDDSVLYSIPEYVYAPPSHLKIRGGNCLENEFDGNCWLHFEYPVYLDGVKQQVNGAVATQVSSVPNDLVSRHRWNGRNLNNLASFKNAVNVRDFGAMGNDNLDDSDAIEAAMDSLSMFQPNVLYFPKGIYRISRPIQLDRVTAIVGAGIGRSLILPSLDASIFQSATPTAPQPLVRTYSGWNGRNILRDMTLFVPTQLADVYALDWRSGSQDSVMRSTSIHLISEYGFKRADSDPDAVPSINVPMALASDWGAGKWYNFNTIMTAADIIQQGFRQLAITDRNLGSKRLSIYQMLSQHAESEANSEISNSTNVDIYGLKGEGVYPILWIRDSSDIGVFGYSGLATPAGLDSLFVEFMNNVGGSCYLIDPARQTELIRIENSSPFRVVNAMPGWRNKSWDEASSPPREEDIARPCGFVNDSIAPEYFSLFSEAWQGTVRYTEKSPAGDDMAHARQERPVYYGRGVSLQ